MKLRQHRQRARSIVVVRDRAWGAVVYARKRALHHGVHAPMQAHDSRLTAWTAKAIESPAQLQELRETIADFNRRLQALEGTP